MKNQTLYLSTSIPYVNAAPHLGFAQELVIADAMARHYRRQGFDVRFQTGSDENSLKNVRAAQDAGMPVSDWVALHAEQFRSLKDTLDLSFDDFIRTSSEQRHAVGVETLWQHCMARGDLYRRHYRGLYCVGCEQFYEPGELVDGACPEHLAPLEIVEEENWFFRLSRYAKPLRTLIETDALHVQPAKRKREVLEFIDRGLHDFSVSRSRERAHGWGIPVPGDPYQVLYVWFDALGNYISALNYGSDDDRLFLRYWTHAARRIHVIGKGVVRFHAVYWPAMLLSAGVPLPTEVRIHDYLTVDGIKIAKSRGNAIGPEGGGGTARGRRRALLPAAPRAHDRRWRLQLQAPGGGLPNGTGGRPGEPPVSHPGVDPTGHGAARLRVRPRTGRAGRTSTARHRRRSRELSTSSGLADDLAFGGRCQRVCQSP